jgi:transcriptional regulator with XRE-family HTH domain
MGALMAKVARNIRARRTERGWTQQALADRIGVDRVFVTQLAGATRNVSLDILERLARVFRVKPSTLLE